MNKTQTQWSGTFGCCHEKKTDLTAFWIAAAGFFVMFVGFFFVMVVIGMRKPTPHIDASDINAQPQIIDPNDVPRISSINVDNSDDDEPLINNKTQNVDAKNDNLVDLHE